MIFILEEQIPAKASVKYVMMFHNKINLNITAHGPFIKIYMINLGDSGGPLYRWTTDIGRDTKRAVLIGVVSRGTGCANFNKPGIYTRVQYHLDWIKKKILKGNCQKEYMYGYQRTKYDEQTLDGWKNPI